MNTIKLIKHELGDVGYPERSVRTNQIRAISAKIYRNLEQLFVMR